MPIECGRCYTVTAVFKISPKSSTYVKMSVFVHSLFCHLPPTRTPVVLSHHRFPFLTVNAGCQDACPRLHHPTKLNREPNSMAAILCHLPTDILLPILQHIYHVDPVPQPIRTPDHRSGRVTCAEPARASTSGALPLKDQN
jgi:hypothetical protein